MAELLTPEPINYARRWIVAVRLPDGAVQPFYRSSGHNSGKPGTWLPFDGLAYQGLWLNKSRFVHNPPYQILPDPRYHRYGSPELMEVSDWLGGQEWTEPGPEVTPEEADRFLESAGFHKPEGWD